MTSRHIKPTVLQLVHDILTCYYHLRGQYNHSVLYDFLTLCSMIPIIFASMPASNWIVVDQYGNKVITGNNRKN